MSAASSDRQAPKRESAIDPRAGGWLFGLALALLVLLGVGGDSLTEALRYERDAVLAGEWWRLLTAHLVHGSMRHLLLNVAGLALIAALFPRDYSALAWLGVALASMAAINLGFVFYEPQLEWYVGFSGVLHGALAAGAVSWFRRESRPMALALAVILVGKLLWEQTQGAMPLAGDLPVVVDAHLYGALGGAAAGLGLWAHAQGWLVRRRSL